MSETDTRPPTYLAGLPEQLCDWLPGQRWFAGKTQPIREVRLVSVAPLVSRGSDPALHPGEAGVADLTHLVVEVVTADQTDRYQLLLGARRQLPERLEHAVIGTAAGGEDGLERVSLYDAAHDSELTGWLLEQLAAAGESGAAVGPLRFFRRAGVALATDAPSLVLGLEQSNTSLVFGDQLICKTFRRLSPGTNPDLEVTRALAEAGSVHIADVYGWYEMDLSGEPTTLGVLQQFLRTASNGWELALTSVRDLYANSGPRSGSELFGHDSPTVIEPVHAAEAGGDFAPEAYRLGVATAEVHRDLATSLGTSLLTREQLREQAEAMTDRLLQAARTVPDLVPYVETLRTAFADLAGLAGSDRPVRVQRVHGDLHLGQVLRTETGWALIDFEGEPSRPLTERRAPHSPLKDVAGMLRSFDYAAQHLLADHPDDVERAAQGAEWAQRNREAFTDGYVAAGGLDPRVESVLARALEIDKAVYEAVYEAQHRPAWLRVPLTAVARLARAKR